MSHKILFFAEAVTLAHVARPLALASALPPNEFEMTIACSDRYRSFLADVPAQIAPLNSISGEQFARALAAGRPVYDAETLRRYVREDLDLIESTRPSLVVGDFRLSLSVSCRLAGVPYATITNAYWSPYFAGRQPFPLPVLPMTRALPVPAAAALFALARPIAFAMHSAPMNRVRTENGLAPLGRDLRRVYADADHVLYADIPSLFPMRDLPPRHIALGPILWSPPQARPAWWNAIPAGKPVVYVTLGSSGAAQSLRVVLDALASMDILGIVSTAGQDVSLPTGASNLFVAPYLPGTEAAARSALVVCNGGSPTSQQALAAGVPVLGIAANMDQFLNMGAIADAEAGILLRADRLRPNQVRAAIERLLADTSFTRAAGRLSAEIDAAMPAGDRFRRWAWETVQA